MKKPFGTLFKSGNSYAIRVPMDWVDQHELKEGDRIQLPQTPRLAAGEAEQDRSYVPPPEPGKGTDGDLMPGWD